MPDQPEIVLVNEFVEVRVRLLQTRNGRALEVYSGRTNARTILDSFALDVLASMDEQDLVVRLQRHLDQGDPPDSA